METHDLLNLNKRCRKLFLHAKQLPIKGYIDIRCNAVEAALERRAIHNLNTHLFLNFFRVNVNITTHFKTKTMTMLVIIPLYDLTD